LRERKKNPRKFPVPKRGGKPPLPYLERGRRDPVEEKKKRDVKA